MSDSGLSSSDESLFHSEDDYVVNSCAAANIPFIKDLYVFSETENPIVVAALSDGTQIHDENFDVSSVGSCGKEFSSLLEASQHLKHHECTLYVLEAKAEAGSIGAVVAGLLAGAAIGAVATVAFTKHATVRHELNIGFSAFEKAFGGAQVCARVTAALTLVYRSNSWVDALAALTTVVDLFPRGVFESFNLLSKQTLAQSAGPRPWALHAVVIVLATLLAGTTGLKRVANSGYWNLPAWRDILTVSALTGPFVDSLLPRVYELVTDTPWISEELINIDASSVQFIEDVRTFGASGAVTEIGHNKVVCDRVLMMEKQMMEIQSKVSKARLSSVTTAAFDTAAAKVRSWVKDVERSGFGKGGTRPPPLVVRLWGDSSVGKSALTPLLIAAVMRGSLKLGPQETLESQIYTRNPGSPYWSGYHGQAITVYDDWGQQVDSPGNPNPDFFELIRACNSAPWNLNMAEIENKANTFFNSQMIVLSSNKETPAICSVNHKEAVLRRIEFDCRVERGPISAETISSGEVDLSVYTFKVSERDETATENTRKTPYTTDFWGLVEKLRKARELRSDNSAVRRQQIAEMFSAQNGEVCTELATSEEVLGKIHVPDTDEVRAYCHKYNIAYEEKRHWWGHNELIILGEIPDNEWFFFASRGAHVIAFEDSMFSRIRTKLAPLEGFAAFIRERLVEKMNSLVGETNAPSWWRSLSRGTRTGLAIASLYLAVRGVMYAARSIHAALTAVFPLANSSSGEGLRHVTIQRGRFHKKKNAVPQSGPCSETVDLGRSLAGNCVRLAVGNSTLGWLTGLQDQVAMLPTHVWVACLAHCGGIPLPEGVIPEEDLEGLHEDDDLTFVRLPKTLPRFKKIVERFLPEREMNFSDFTAHIFTDVVRITDAEIGVTPIQYDAKGTKYALSTYMTYRAGTRPGDSGAIVGHGESSNAKLIGFHVAASPVKGYGRLISREEIQQAIEALNDNTTAQSGEAPRGLPFPVVARAKYNNYASGRSKIKCAPLHDAFPVTKGRAILRPVGDVDPLARALTNYNMSHRVDPKEWTPARQVVLRLIHNKSEAKVLDIKTAVSNWRELASIDRSTSSGYPYCKQHKDTTKRRFFEETEEVIPTAELEGIVEKCRAGLLKGEKPVFADNLKDETRPLKRCRVSDPDNIKTRAFSAAPVDFVVLCRQYLGAWVSSLNEHRISNGTTAGINPAGPEWGLLAAKLQEKGDNMFDGDWSSFDASLPASLLREVGWYAEEWYKTFDPNWSEEDQRVREKIFDAIAESHHWIDDMIVSWPGGLPSGCYGTNQIDSVANLVVLVRAFQTKLSDREIAEEVYMVTHGDDNIVSVTDRVAAIVTPKAIEAYGQSIGMVYTSADKAEITGYKSLPKVSFLKRSFVQLQGQPGLWLAPLERDSIRSSVQWTRKGVCMQDYVRTVEAALEELELHQDEGKEDSQVIRHHAHLANIRPIHATLPELICKYWTGVKLDYHQFTPYWFSRHRTFRCATAQQQAPGSDSSIVAASN